MRTKGEEEEESLPSFLPRRPFRSTDVNIMMASLAAAARWSVVLPTSKLYEDFLQQWGDDQTVIVEDSARFVSANSRRYV